jgi:hypothetical protein
MKTRLSLIAFLTFAAAAYAGAPLKGVDVKLGKNPGGKAAARTTGADGKIDFGVLPPGSYYVIIDAGKTAAAFRDTLAEIEIKGAKDGAIRKRWDFALRKAFDASPGAAARAGGEEKIVFTSDGHHPIEIAATTLVKSKSNISNN